MNVSNFRASFDAASGKERLKQCVDLLPQLLANWESSHPHWQIEVLLWLLDGALTSLRHYIESEKETEISWDSPFVELHFPVECSWETEGGDKPAFRLTSGQLRVEEMVDCDSAVKALSELVVQHLQIVALQEHTNGTAFEKRGEIFTPTLNPEDVDRVRKQVPPELQDDAIQRLFWPKAFGAGSVDFGNLQSGDSIGTEAAEKLAAIEQPLIFFPLEAGGRKLRVITVFELHPLIADADTRTAYFPFVVGLAIQSDEPPSDKDELLSDLAGANFVSWSDEDKSALWVNLAKLIGMALEELGPKAAPEMVEAVVSVNAQIKVTVPRKDEAGVNRAMSAMLEQLKATGEILNVSFCSGPLLLADPELSARWQQLLDAVENAETADMKGKSLEELIAVLFATVPGFSVLNRVRTESEEIDIWISNDSDCRPFSGERDVILVECKNWSGKCGKNEFNLFYNKIANRGGRCTIGFLVSWNGFAETFTTEMLRASRESPLIVPIDGVAIRNAVQTGNFLDTIIDARRQALMV